MIDTPDKIWHLIAKVLNGEASKQEEEELNKMLHQDESLQQRYEILSRIWSETQGTTGYLDSDGARNTISRIINKAELIDAPIEISPPKTGLNRRRYLWIAASFVIILASGWFWITKRISAQEEIKQEALEVMKGSRRIMSLLPDGTTVWLNAGSKLYYDKEFTGPTREVRLEGEAFFDVVKQPDRVFIVHVSGIDIKVLGTAFNVKSYPEDKTVETILYRGSVQVVRQEEAEDKAIQLNPNDKLTLLKEAAIATENLSKEEQASPVKEIPPKDYKIIKIDSTKKENERIETAWLYSRLEFHHERFEEVAKKLERWYNVTIEFNDEKVKELRLYGSFEKETVETAFAAFKKVKPFTYEFKGQKIYIGSFE